MGVVTTYAPLAHLPRSMTRQRSLQKGKSVSLAFVGFWQIGQRNLMDRLRDMGRLLGCYLGYGNVMQNQLLNSGHEIVIVRIHDFAAVKLPRLRLQAIGHFVHENLAVDFRGVHDSAALEEKVRFLRHAFK